jgi:glycosyltransferase involved in cell wall biosynthesis
MNNPRPQEILRYSVIIPHYMDCSRLERLLKSIPVTRNDIEVLVIDDCSPDQILLTELKIRLPYKQIIWLSTRYNAGAGAARNIGLDNSNGQWLLFADSDDQFLPNAFELFDEKLQPEDELVYYMAEGVIEYNGSPSARSDVFTHLVRAYSTMLNESKRFELAIKHTVPWSKIYSRKFINSLGMRFDEVRWWNDVAFNVLAAVQTKRIRSIDSYVYRVHRRASSLTTDQSAEAFIQRFYVSRSVAVRLEKLGFKKVWSATDMMLLSINYGPWLAIKVCWLAIRSPMLIEWKRFMDIDRWKRYIKRRSTLANEIKLTIDLDANCKVDSSKKYYK